MTTDPVRELFDLAVVVPPTERDSYLSQACSDPVLRAAVDSLLSAHDRAGHFLSDPTINLDPLLTEPGRQLGPYRLVRVIGEGGYGTVYLARQDRPLARDVAVKVIRAGRTTGQTLARFDLERQALARMEHPNIARVFDTGLTPDGRPYFVMEWVDGLSVTEYCRQKQLPTTDRLTIFREVCAAVQHAHQKGIIHRDLKPSNVLVTDRDGVAAVKVIDFGIAKAVDGTGDDPSLTRNEQFLGTPQYMSPEQVGPGPADIDTRADVYALGAMLYELLADQPPFDAETLRSAAAEEVRRILTETEPPRPSSRKPVARELDWIVFKAIEKDRTRRYPSVESMSADVKRFLSCEPVEAGPPTARYRLGKFIRRHRRLVATVWAVALSLTAGTTVATVGLVRARADRDRAVAAGELARKAQRQEFSARQFIFTLVASPPNKPQPTPSFLDQLARRADDGLLADDKQTLAVLRDALAEAYVRQGLWRPAIVQYRKFFALRPPSSDDKDTAATLHNFGAALLGAGDFSGAVEQLQLSLAMYRRLYHGQDGVDDARAIEDLGLAKANLDDLATAESLLRQAIWLYDAAGVRDRQGAAMQELAQLRKLRGDPRESAKLWTDGERLRHPTPRADTRPS